MTESYYNAGNIEAIDVIDAFKLNFNLGNVIKYVIRAGRKDPDSYTNDLLKARFYIDHEITRYTLEHIQEEQCPGE